MANTVYKMNETTTIRFVELYRSEECLWNPFHPDYKHKEARWKAAERIADRLNVYGFGPSEAVQKFKNIRSSYCQELKKIHFSVQQGLEVYKPKVVWFHVIDSFLKPYVAVQLQTKDSPSNGHPIQHHQPPKQISHQSQQHQAEEDISGEMIEINDDELVKVEPNFHFDTVNNNNNNSSEYYNGKSSQHYIPRKDRPLDSPDPSKRQKMETPEYVSLNREAKTLDEFDAFARFIGNQLRELPQDYAVRAESKILQCLADERINYFKDHAIDKYED